MLAWITYFIERYNPLLSLTVIIGIALTGVVINHRQFEPFPFIISCLTIFYISFLLRLHNDINDFEKDKIAFPKRVLQSGLISKSEARLALKFLEYGLAVYLLFLFFIGWGNTKIALILATAYLWFLLHDFYAKSWLERRPFFHGFAQQGIFFFLTILVVSTGRPSLAFTSIGIGYAFAVFASFFTYEICRKLNPYSHPISMSYVHFYGFRKTFWIACLLLFFSGIGAYALGLQLWLWPAELVVFVSLYMLFKNPKRYRLAELAAGFSLILHTWAGPLQYI
jgi:4-hydroxybenzoate polyprenyltransferase